MANEFQQVATYNKTGLANLLNVSPFISLANKKFKNFNEQVPQNRGSSVDFRLPNRMTSVASLVASFQGIEERVLRLTIDQAISASYEFGAQEFVMDAKGFMELYGFDAIAEVGAKIEANVATCAETDTYRFYGDGVTPITNSGQLAKALALFRNAGQAKTMTKGILDDLTYPEVVNSNLNQFTLARNNREAMSWEIGSFSNCDWYESNLLKLHTAGTEGQAGSVLTVVSVTKNADGGVTSIVFSGTDAASDANSVKAYDKFVFSDGVSGKTNLRFRTFRGHEVSKSPVQFRAEADAASTAGSQVTVSIYPPLQAASGVNQNINTEIVAGMQATALPNHRCGLIMAGDPLFLGMPSLPSVIPYPSSSIVDKDTGASLRQYYGNKFGEDQYGMVHDAIWGKKLAGDYAMMVALPE